MLLQREDGFSTFEVKFEQGRDVVFAELPPGNYGFREIYCNSKHWNLALQHWPRFQVYAEKTALLGGVLVYIDENNALTVSRTRRSKNRDEALLLFGRISTDRRTSVVSAYTGKVIDPLAIELRAKWKHWELRDASDKKMKTTKNDWPSLHSCYRAEGDVNGLWLGNLQSNVIYENGTLTRVTIENTWNSFSPHFIDCVKSVLTEFHPVKKGQLHYVLYI